MSSYHETPDSVNLLEVYLTLKPKLREIYRRFYLYAQNEYGYAFASDKHFAEFFNLGLETFQRKRRTLLRLGLLLKVRGKGGAWVWVPQVDPNQKPARKSIPKSGLESTQKSTQKSRTPDLTKTQRDSSDSDSKSKNTPPEPLPSSANPETEEAVRVVVKALVDTGISSGEAVKFARADIALCRAWLSHPKSWRYKQTPAAYLAQLLRNKSLPPEEKSETEKAAPAVKFKAPEPVALTPEQASSRYAQWGRRKQAEARGC